MISAVIMTIALIIAIRTVSYGIWTVKSRNISGGVFVILLAVSEVVCAAIFIIQRR